MFNDVVQIVARLFLAMACGFAILVVVVIGVTNAAAVSTTVAYVGSWQTKRNSLATAQVRLACVSAKIAVQILILVVCLCKTSRRVQVKSQQEKIERERET